MALRVFGWVSMGLGTGLVGLMGLGCILGLVGVRGLVVVEGLVCKGLVC